MIISHNPSTTTVTLTETEMHAVAHALSKTVHLMTNAGCVCSVRVVEELLQELLERGAK